MTSATFQRDLEILLNRYSQENASNTPDFILAQYLTTCLDAWNEAVQQRETWYGRDARPGAPRCETIGRVEQQGSPGRGASGGQT
jgi:hypothetical protein